MNLSVILDTLKGYKRGVEKEPLKIMLHDVLDNLFLSLIVYLRGDVYPILEYTLTVNKALKDRCICILGFIKNEIKQCGRKLYEEIKERLKKTIALNFIRELYWIRGKKLMKEEFENLYPISIFAHWVLARSSIARIGLLHDMKNNKVLMTRIKELGTHIMENWDKYWEKVIEEQGKIKGSINKL